MMKNITASIVLYKNPPQKIRKCVESIKNENFFVRCIVVDNSPTDKLGKELKNCDIEYHKTQKNIGYGAGHNIALRKSLSDGCGYHLVVNPDIYFERGTLESLLEYMEIKSNSDIGLITPNVLYPDGSMQNLCKLLPTPFDLFRRRFLPSTGILKKMNDKYEMRHSGYNKTMNVPYLSGCFMFFRVNALKEAGLFDERFFMYLEDTDITRRIHKHYKTVYYPEVSVFHGYEKGSYKNIKLLQYHLISTIKYFNKWGYFLDSERREFNRIATNSYVDNK